MSEERQQQQHPQEPADGGEEVVGAPGADQAGADRGITGGEVKPSRHPEEPAEGSEDDVEAPGAERAANGG
jgi:hypothetical protein